MKKYLLDTNICIYHIKGLFDIDRKIKKVGIEKFIELFKIVPISSCFDIYAREKVKLRKEGKVIDDFDLLIGCSAISNNLILVTRNVKHFDRLSSIKIENWADD